MTTTSDFVEFLTREGNRSYVRGDSIVAIYHDGQATRIVVREALAGVPIHIGLSSSEMPTVIFARIPASMNEPATQVLGFLKQHPAERLGLGRSLARMLGGGLTPIDSRAIVRLNAPTAPLQRVAKIGRTMMAGCKYKLLHEPGLYTNTVGVGCFGTSPRMECADPRQDAGRVDCA